MPKEESSPVPLKYIDVARTTFIFVDILLEKQVDENWHADEERELSDARTGFTRCILLNERTPDGHAWSGERLTRKQTTSRPDSVWTDMWKLKSDAAKRKAKQKWTIEKPKLDNARQVRGVFFIEPYDEEFKHSMKNARRKLEIPMPAAMPFHIAAGQLAAMFGKHKTKYACIVGADESMRVRLEGVPHRYH